MRLARVQFTIGQFMIPISVVGLLLGIAEWTRSNLDLFILIAVVSLTVLGPIGLQL